MKPMIGVVGAIVLIALVSATIGNNSAPTPAASTAVHTAPASTAEQKAKAVQCGKALSSGHAAWVDMEKDGDYVTVVATPEFLEAGYDTREAFTALTVCYYTDGRMDDTVKIVEFLDPHTHAPFGHWYKGMQLTFDR